MHIDAVSHVHSSLRSDPTFMVGVVSLYGRALQYACGEIVNNRGLSFPSLKPMPLIHALLFAS
jgi:hypothetical protein